MTKAYIDAMATGINWLSTKPKNPQIGDVYLDQNTHEGYIWQGNQWAKFSSSDTYIQPKDLAPTEEQLEKHPALKQAWEEYLIIKRLLGV